MEEPRSKGRQAAKRSGISLPSSSNAATEGFCREYQRSIRAAAIALIRRKSSCRHNLSDSLGFAAEVNDKAGGEHKKAPAGLTAEAGPAETGEIEDARLPRINTSKCYALK